MVESSVIPEFAMHEYGLDSSEIEELEKSLATATRTGKDRFMAFTDILVENVKNS